ncbi:SDR family oxidoreductase [Pseudomonas sp.]|uniref:SDR family oxidoreductase n=1 Tax=Pseudomonas sp. TaxID=306 RepID=UPI0035688816
MNKTNSGRVALVTGAANGIGRAAALAFANSGYSVVVSDIDSQAGQETVALIKAAEGDASFIRCDVSCDADVRLLIDGTVSAYGRLDCAFNNAGIEIERCKLADGNKGVFDAIMNVNVKGVWLCMKYQIAAMLAQGGGAIVNTASVAGLIAAPKQGIYSASKHAVIGLTKTAAVEYARMNIRVNAVCPAVIDTEMFRRASTDNPKHVALAVAAHPLGRIGTVEEIAAAVLYLCSDSAGFTTGVALPVDGGLTA